MCDAGLPMPISLTEAAATGLVTSPFVYSRRYGFFCVPFGKHQVAMSLLMAWELGHNIPSRKTPDVLQVRDFGDGADLLLESVAGYAFRSAVPNARVTAWNKANLNAEELAAFGDVDFLQP
jgi:hypothetical protein